MALATDQDDFAEASTGEQGAVATTSAEATGYSLDQIASQLSDGYWQPYGGRRSWDVTQDRVITVNISGLDSIGQSLAQDALDAWAAVSGLSFEIVTGPANITIDDAAAGAYTSSSMYGSNLFSSTVNISSSWHLGTARNDAYAFQTYMHEIGHALGLGHAGNYNGSAVYGIDNIFADDSWQTSLMSYFDQTENTWVNASYAYAITPMMADVLAIQALYGTMPIRPSDTVYGVGGNTGTYLDDLTAFSRAVALTIFDSGGNDLLDLSDQVDTQRIDLNPESLSDILGSVGNLVIGRDTYIERVKTGAGNDEVMGNIAHNVIELGGGADFAYGGAGFDTLVGGDGNDTLDGGDQADNLFGGIGNDILDGGNGADRLFGEDGADTLSGGAGDDVAWGGSGNDSLRGGEGNDRLYGEAGNDILRGEGGADELSGGPGNDSLVGGIGHDLLSGGTEQDTLDGGDGNDTLYGEAGFDLLHGNGGDDLLDGGDQADNLFGGEGNDTLLGGAGFDRLFGGSGADWLDAGNDDDALFGESGNDTLWGGSGDDRFFGGSGNDRLYGQAGNDVIHGNAGFDTLVGGAGDDTLWGDFNADIFAFLDGDGQDTIADFDAENDFEKIDLSGVTAIVDWNDLVLNHLTEAGSNVVIDTHAGQTITLLGVDLAQLDAADFLF